MAHLDYTLAFGVLKWALVPCNHGWCRVRAGVAVLVLLPVGMRCFMVGPPLEMEQGALLESLVGYTT